MKTYRITIRATIEKDIFVDSESEEEAKATAHGLFNVEPEDGEDYTQEVVNVFIQREGI